MWQNDVLMKLLYWIFLSILGLSLSNQGEREEGTEPTGYTGSKGTIEVSAGNTDAEDKAYCISMKKKHNIVPGQSFGTLPKGQVEKEYLEARC